MSGVENAGALAPVIAMGPRLTYDDKGKLVLPEPPHHDDRAAQAAWLTCVINLDPKHPIRSGAWHGQAGPEGSIVLQRIGAPDLRIEPARAVNTPMKFIEALTGRRLRSDGMLPAYKGEHCRQIAHVVQLLCDMDSVESDEEQIIAVLGTFFQEAEAREGLTTYGTASQRYEAAVALGRDFVGRHYLIDSQTGEYVIAVSDLADAARRHVGSSLPRGWLNVRMSLIGWARIRLDGHALPGREGRSGPHATVNAYRGLVPAAEAVTK